MQQEESRGGEGVEGWEKKNQQTQQLIEYDVLMQVF